MNKTTAKVDSVDRLADVIAAAVNSYCASHPDANMTPAEIREALNLVDSALPD